MIRYYSVPKETFVTNGTIVEPLTATENGTYAPPAGTAYSPVTVNVEGGGGSGDLNNPIQLELAAEGSHLATVLTAGEIYTLCQTGTPYFTVTAEQIATYEDPYKSDTKYFINEYFYDDSDGPVVIGLRFVMLGIADTTDVPTKTVLDLLQSPADADSRIIIAGGQ